MYTPPAFTVEDQRRLAEFMARYSFATLVTQGEDGLPFASHVPVLYDRTAASPGRLYGHLARANPQRHHLETQREVLVIFHGPHAYVSPRWYRTTPSVPTWNYAVVHAYGSPNVFSDESRVRRILDDMLDFYEGASGDAVADQLPPDFLSQQMKGIVGFEIRLIRLQGKFKLGQNRPAADRLGAVEQLSRSARAEDRLLAQFMTEAGVLDRSPGPEP